MTLKNKALRTKKRNSKNKLRTIAPIEPFDQQIVFNESANYSLSVWLPIVCAGKTGITPTSQMFTQFRERKYQYSWPPHLYWLGLGCFENEKKIISVSWNSWFLTSKYKEVSRCDTLPFRIMLSVPCTVVHLKYVCLWLRINVRLELIIWNKIRQIFLSSNHR